MSVAKNDLVPDKFDVDGEFAHLADGVTMSQIQKRTLKNGLIRFLKEKHPDDFPHNDKTENE